MRVRVASTAHLEAASIGYGIGLTEGGDRIEFIGDWRALESLGAAVDQNGPQPADIQEWQILAVNGALRLPLSREGMAERAAFVKAAIGDQSHPD